MAAVIDVPSIVQALGVELANSVPTTTTTIRSETATPIEAPVYVATVDTAATPAGFAVCEIATAIDSSYMNYNPVTYASDDWIRRITPIVSVEPVEKCCDDVSA